MEEAKNWYRNTLAEQEKVRKEFLAALGDLLGIAELHHILYQYALDEFGVLEEAFFVTEPDPVWLEKLQTPFIRAWGRRINQRSGALTPTLYYFSPVANACNRSTCFWTVACNCERPLTRDYVYIARARLREQR